MLALIAVARAGDADSLHVPVFFLVQSLATQFLTAWDIPCNTGH